MKSGIQYEDNGLLEIIFGNSLPAAKHVLGSLLLFGPLIIWDRIPKKVLKCWLTFRTPDPLTPSRERKVTWLFSKALMSPYMLKWQLQSLVLWMRAFCKKSLIARGFNLVLKVLPFLQVFSWDLVHFRSSLRTWTLAIKLNLLEVSVSQWSQSMPESFCFFLSLSTGFMWLGHFHFRENQACVNQRYACCQGSWGQSEVLIDGLICGRSQDWPRDSWILTKKLFEELLCSFPDCSLGPALVFQGSPGGSVVKIPPGNAGHSG